MTITLLANQCPAPQYRASLLSVKAAASAPNAPVSSSLAAGDTFALLTKFNQNATRLDITGAYGGGGYFVANGLGLSFGAGLAATVAAGTAMIGGAVCLEVAATLALPASAGPVFVWLLQSGLLTYTVTTAPPSSPACLLGSCTTSATAITASDTSGVLFGGGTLIRFTADGAQPTDTPPAGLRFFTITQGGYYLWDGAAYHSASAGSGSGVTGYLGLYNPNTAYVTGNIVGQNNALFIAVQAGTNQPPPLPLAADTAYWKLFVPPGATGPSGAAGAAGTQGPAGVSVYNPRGAWNASVAYAIADAVYDSTGAYVAILASTGFAISDTSHWKQILPPGPSGATGANLFTSRGNYSVTTAYAVYDLVIASGAVYYAAAASTGQLVTNTAYWTLLVPAAPAGTQGIQGVQGTAGTAGAAGANGSATVSVGTTTTVTPGSSASVTNTGSSTAAVLNFSVPQGAAGTNGTNGAAGTNGTNGAAGTNGTNGAAGTNGTNAQAGFLIFIPGTLAAGADVLEVILPSSYSSRAPSKVSAVCGTAGSTATTFTVQLATSTGAFTAAQTSDTFTVGSGVYQMTPVTTFTAGLTGSGENRVRVNITAAGTGAANLTVKIEF